MKHTFTLHRALKPWEGRTVTTYNGNKNVIIEVAEESLLVGTKRSPTGTPVSMHDVQHAIETLLEEGAVDIHHASPTSYRGSFVVGLLLTLPGVDRDPNTSGTILRDRRALERFLTP